MKKTILVLLLILILITTFYSNAIAITFISRQNPPYVNKDFDIVTGVAIDITKDITKKHDLSYNIEVLEWGNENSYINSSNKVLIANNIDKNKNNLDNYIKLPITQQKINLISFKKNSNKENQKNIVTIGIENNSDQIIEVLKNEFSSVKFNQEKIIGNNIEKLIFGDLDYVAYQKEKLYWVAGQMSYKPKDFEDHGTIEKTTLYYFFPKTIDENIIEVFKKELENIKKNNEIVDIMKNYEVY